MDILIENGADVNEQDERYRNTPLHVAVITGIDHNNWFEKYRKNAVKLLYFLSIIKIFDSKIKNGTN